MRDEAAPPLRWRNNTGVSAEGNWRPPLSFLTQHRATGALRVSTGHQGRSTRRVGAWGSARLDLSWTRSNSLVWVTLQESHRPYRSLAVPQRPGDGQISVILSAWDLLPPGPPGKSNTGVRHFPYVTGRRPSFSVFSTFGPRERGVEGGRVSRHLVIWICFRPFQGELVEVPPTCAIYEGQLSRG